MWRRAAMTKRRPNTNPGNENKCDFSFFVTCNKLVGLFNIILLVPIQINVCFTFVKSRILPREEADWHGLSFGEACHKQLILERLADEKSKIPLKDIYRKDLFDKLKQGLMDDIDPEIMYTESPKDSTMTKVIKTLTGKFK